MRIVKVGVLAPTNKGIPLGVQGENSATQVEFDTRPWFREYPYGTVSAVARRDGDPAPYPLTLDVEDSTAVWQVSDTDTAKAGEGAVELTMTSAGARVRSLTFKTLVTTSLTDAPVEDDAWYGWLDKAVVKVDETMQSAQRKMAEVDEEWTGLKADVTAKVDECGKAAAKAAEDAHHAKVDAQATAKALESAEGSVAKAEASAKRAVDAMLDADDSAVEASRSALSAGRSAEAAAGSSTNAATSASYAATSASNAADAASAASRSASAAEQSATDASNAKAAAQTAKAEAEAAKSEAATSASNAATSATAAAKSASDAAASVGAINVIAPKNVFTAAIAEGYKALAVGDEVRASGQGGIGCGYKASASGFESVAIGDSATSGGNSAIAIGLTATANDNGSIALGARSVTSKIDELSIGCPATETVAECKREITHVSEPTAPTSASTKKYTDDNDAKTLNEAKKYTDDNTSNALVGNVSGKLLHVEDAWPSKPLGLTIDGACKQDGTPSPENPVPIKSVGELSVVSTGSNLLPPTSEWEKINGYLMCVKNPIPAGTTITSTYMGNPEGLSGNVRMEYWRNKGENDHVISQMTNYSSTKSSLTTVVPEGAEYIGIATENAAGNYLDLMRVQVEIGSLATDYSPYVGASTPITLPAEHPYLAKLPDGTCDTIEIDRYGNATLVARIKRIIIAKDGKWRYEKTGGGASIYYIENDGKKNTVGLTTCAVGRYAYTPNSVFVGSGGYPTLVDGDETDANGVIDKFGENNPVYYQLATPVTYPLGKLDIPSLPESISNVWTEAELTTNMSMAYKRDINIAFENLAQAVVAAAAGE